MGKAYAQVLVKYLEFKEETYPRRLILYPSRRSVDGGATYFRDYKKKNFIGRYNTWWSNFYMVHWHKEGVFFSKEWQQMFQQKSWQKIGAEPIRNEFRQIVSWGRGVWGLYRNSTPKPLPQYIGRSRNLQKYSKFDNFVQRTQEQYQIQTYRYITQVDGSVIKVPLSVLAPTTSPHPTY